MLLRKTRIFATPSRIFFFSILLEYSWYTMLCSFQVYSKVIQLYINIYIPFQILFNKGYYKILNIVPCALERISGTSRSLWTTLRDLCFTGCTFPRFYTYGLFWNLSRSLWTFYCNILIYQSNISWHFQIFLWHFRTWTFRT